MGNPKRDKSRDRCWERHSSHKSFVNRLEILERQLSKVSKRRSHSRSSQRQNYLSGSSVSKVVILLMRCRLQGIRSVLGVLVVTAISGVSPNKYLGGRNLRGASPTDTRNMYTPSEVNLENYRSRRSQGSRSPCGAMPHTITSNELVNAGAAVSDQDIIENILIINNDI